MSNLKKDIYDIISSNIGEDEKIRRITNIANTESVSSASNQTDTGAGTSEDINNMSANDAAKDAQKSANEAKDVSDAAQAAADAAQAAADAAKNAADSNKADANGDKTQAQASAKAAQDAADKAQDAADKAQDAADKAQQKADQEKQNGTSESAKAAQDAADKAQDAANQAQNSANKAQDSANSVKQNGSGNTTQDKVDQSQQKADSAQNSANQAQDAANQAQDSANQAQDAANQAKESASNGDQNGAQQAAQQARQVTANQPISGRIGQQGQQQGQQQNNKQQDKQQNNGAQPQKLSDYDAGYLFAKDFVHDMYKNKGMKPLYGDFYDLPELPEIMKIKKSVNESYNGENDDEIRNVLRDTDLSDIDKAEKICDIINNSNRSYKPNLPKNIEIFKNGAINKDSIMSTGDVIDDMEADEIRRENNIDPVDKDHYTGDDAEASKEEALKPLKKVFDKSKKLGVFTDEQIKQIDKKIEGLEKSYKKSREGIIDWRRVLKNFVSTKSNISINGPVMQNRRIFGKIQSNYPRRLVTNYNKCVIYVDTSYSLNNEDTQLIPILCSEIVNIMKSCNYKNVDLNLFHHSVYKHFEVTPRTILKTDGLLPNVKPGGTNIQEVYKDIYENYTKNGSLNRDIDSIIILSDVSGMSTGSIADNDWIKKFSNSVLKKMLYVIYNDDISEFDLLDEAREYISQLVADISHFEIISLENFRRQLEKSKFNNNENMKSFYKYNNRINEGFDDNDDVLGGFGDDVDDNVLGGFGDDDDSDLDQFYGDENDHVVLKQVDDKDIEETLFKNARINGTLESIIPNYIEVIKKYFPMLKQTGTRSIMLDNPDTYYVEDNLEISIHIEYLYGKELLDAINGACTDPLQNITFNTLVGNVKLTDSIFKSKSPTFIDGDLPKGFPKNILGNFELFKLTNLTNPGKFENFPTRITGNKNKIYLIGSWSQEIQDNLADYVSKNNIKNMFIGQQKAKYGNVAEEISRRIAMGESYINEALGAPSEHGNNLRNIFKRGDYPQRSKYDSDADWDEVVSDYLSSDMKKIEKNNKHFFDLLFNSGNATKEKENSEKKLEEINRQIDFLRRKISNGDKNKNTKNELDALTKLRNKIERKVDNLSNVNKDQSTSILNIDWHRIPADNVQLITNIKKVRDDVRNVSDKKAEQLGKGYAKNVGLKIFVDSNDKISAIYGTFSKKTDDSGDYRYEKPQIIALSSDSGEPVSDPIAIRKLIKDRYDYVVGEVKNKLKKDTGVDLSNITDTYRFGQKNSPNAATLKSCALNIMYNIITILHGSDGAVKYSYKLDEILNPDYYKGKNDTTTDLILDYIFGSDYNGFRNKTDKIIINGRSVNFDNRRSNNQVNKYNWYNACYNDSTLSPDHTIFELFSNIFIKSLLIGSSIRDEVENSPIYGYDDIVDAYDGDDRQKLIDMISKVENVELVSTSLKGLAVKNSVLFSKDKSKITEKTAIPFDAMLLFPDKCVKEYKIDIDVQDAVEARSAYSRRRTLTRGRLKFAKEPSNPNEYFNALYDVYSNIYSLTDPNNAENIIDDIKSTINGLGSYDQNKLHDIANKLIDKGSWDDMNLIDEIQNGLIRKLSIANNLSRIIAGNLGDANFKSFADNHESEIESLYNIGLELVDNIAYIQLNNSTEDDVINNIEAVNDNVKSISKIVENIFGSDYKENIAVANQAERQEKRKTLASRKKNSRFDTIVTELTNTSNSVGAIAGQDQELSDTIGNLLDNVISRVNTIKLNGDYDFAEQNELNDKLDTILKDCNNIQKFSKTDRVYDLFDDLAADCQRLGRILRKYDSTRTAQASFAV